MISEKRDIKPIETIYKNYRFRSKLEAHWAVCFELMGLNWAYEYNGYNLGDLGWYLPDFVLTSPYGQKYVYEVKPREYKGNEKNLHALINSNIGFSGGYILRGDPVNVIIDDSNGELVVCPRCGIIQLNNGHENSISCWVCDNDTPTGGMHPEEQSLVFKDIKYYPHKGDIVLSEKNSILFKKLINSAARKARSARFDHGEVGNVIENKNIVENDDYHLLYDIIKLYITKYPKEILKLLSYFPETKDSRIFLPDCGHKFIDSKTDWCFSENECGKISDSRRHSSELQEIFKNPMDIVYRFGTSNINGSYYIVHLIRTDRYDINKEIDKYYIHDSHIKYLIWGYPQYHEDNVIPPRKFIKQMNINYLKDPIVNRMV